MHPAFAVLILLVCGGFAAKSLLGKGNDEGGITDDGAGVVVIDPELDGAEGSEAGVAEQPMSIDLLALHGSFTGASAVGFAFHMPPELALAAPIGETSMTAPGNWGAEEPPSLQLGVVMISKGSRRAVLQGQVVGVGDQIAGVTVTAIVAGLVATEWKGRRLSYDLDGAVPREFRAEWARRHAAAAEEKSSTPSSDVVVRPAAKNKETGR
jgi:hypothetical protein